MPSDLFFPQELFLQDDAAGLLNLLQQLEEPEADTVLLLLDRAAGHPHTSACLLEFLHSRFSQEELEQARHIRQEKQLGLLDWEDTDWSQLFRWERWKGGCRILEYLGSDEEVLIPEQIGTCTVYEISRLFFLRAAGIARLLVPEGISIGTVLPHEAADLFGGAARPPEIVRLPREVPLPLHRAHGPSAPAFQPAGTDLFLGRYAWEQDGAVRPVCWQVLRREEGRALLLSRHFLELLPYHHNRSAVLWPDCDLRAWLNGPFLAAAFTEEERKLLLPTFLSGEDNPRFHTRSRFHAQDLVFLLSPGQWERYRPHTAAPVAPTPWAARTAGGSASPPLWTGMPGLNTQYAVTLDEALRPDYQGRLVTEPLVGVLPAIWVRLQTQEQEGQRDV